MLVGGHQGLDDRAHQPGRARVRPTAATVVSHDRNWSPNPAARIPR
ncbi:hypothetical protein FRUB_04340 [Fimbriiglobus ruber]|uniref:Uncharacterized protein n=1 Tax=Fimbriiglobus ruber TaxID=1908690 RepID=A0A225DLK4_9BACT|nr:hypothetical protein FRUB_04340 [Fimbriiglobus ruber]